MIKNLFDAFTLLGSAWVLWLLLGLSVTSVAIILERLRNLRSQERLGAKLWQERIEKWMNSGSKPDLKALSPDLAATYPCVEGGLIAVLTRQEAGTAKPDLELLASSYIGRQKLELEKHLAFLGTVGSNAPFIGLFGTVLGIIKAFHDLGGQVQTSGALGISVGISEALVATAVGLLVAIPAVAAFNYFQRKIKTITGRAESLSNYVISLKG